MDIRTALITGIDIPIPQCQLSLHQPKLFEIGYIGEKDFFIGVQTLCINKSMFVEAETVSSEINNFHIFMMVMNDKNSGDKKSAVKQVLKLLFPGYNILITPASLIFQKKDSENLLIDESNFEFLQDVLRQVFCSKTGPMDQQSFNPANAKAKEIAEKLMRGRQRVAEQKNATNISIFSQYVSILSIGLKIPIVAFKEYTMYQLYDTMERYSLYMNWDIDVRSRLAGGKPDSQPDNWMKNIHE